MGGALPSSLFLRLVQVKAKSRDTRGTSCQFPLRGLLHLQEGGLFHRPFCCGVEGVYEQKSCRKEWWSRRNLVSGESSEHVT